MRRVTIMVFISLLLGGCASTKNYLDYQDATGLQRPKSEFDVTSAQCEMYASNRYQEKMRTASIGGLTMGGSYVAGAQIGGAIARERDYKTCMQAQGFLPKNS